MRAAFGLDVPAGAVREPLTITFDTFDTGAPESDGRTRISLGLALAPASAVFERPLRLFVPWIDARVPKGVEPSSFDLRRVDESGAAVPLAGSRTNQTPVPSVEGQTSRLGRFFATSPREPNAERLELTPEELTLALGERAAISARLLSPAGSPLEADITLTVLPARVGRVDDGGVFVAEGPGLATLSASSGRHVATAAVRVRGPAVGPSTFEYFNPFPTGNDLLGGGIEPGGLGALYVGGHGTILAHAADGTFVRLSSVPGVELRAIAGTSAEDAVAVGTDGARGVLLRFRGTSAGPEVRAFAPTSVAELNAVAFDGRFGMAVGAGNDVLSFRDGGWEPTPHPSYEPLIAVRGDGAGAFIALGAVGSLFRFDPESTAWDTVGEGRAGQRLVAALLSSFEPVEAIAVSDTRLWTFSDGGWTFETLPADAGVVEGTAVGVFGGRLWLGARRAPGSHAAEGVLLTRSHPAGGDDGGQPAPFDVLALRGAQVPRAFVADGPGADDGVVVGELGAIYAWRRPPDGGAAGDGLHELSRGFHGTVKALATGRDALYAAVEGCTGAPCGPPGEAPIAAVLRRRASGELERLGEPLDAGALAAVAADETGRVVVAGALELLRWDGSAWRPLPVAGARPGPVHALRRCGDGLIAAGAAGAWYEGTFDTLTLGGSVGGSTLRAIACAADGSAWMAGDGVLLERRSRESPWVGRSSATLPHARWRAVSSAAPGEAFAFGVAAYGVYFDTASLSAVEQPGGLLPDEVTGLWASAPDVAYAVGRVALPVHATFALRFDGASWRPVDPGARRPLTCIEGTSADELWLGGEGGALLRGVDRR